MAARTMSDLRQLIDDLVVAREDVVGELDLNDRPQPVDSHSESRRHDAAFREWRVEHAVRAVLLLQPVSGPEDAAEVADVLAVDDDILVALEHDVQSAVEGLDHVHVRHIQSSLASSYCSLRCQGISS